MSARFVYSFISLLFTLSSFAQEYNYQHYDLTNGLGGLTVYSIAQDKNGYLWFGTETGLTRFDGSRFRNFTTADGLPDNEVLKMHVDSKNRVWILSFTKAICYYKDGIIYSSKTDSTLKRLKFTTEPQNIYEDAEGNIVIIEYAKVHILSNNGSIKDIDVYEGWSLGNMSIGLNERGNVIISSMLKNGIDNWGLLEINRSDLNLSFEHVSNSSIHISDLTFIVRPHLFVFQVEKKIHVRTQENLPEVLLEKPDNFIGFSFINDTLFTMNCTNKVLLYNTEANKVIDTFSLGKLVNVVFRDSEGNFWFATNGYGIYRLTSLAFKSFSFLWKNNFLPVYSIEKKDNLLYAGTNQSLLWKIDLTQNILMPIKFDVSYGEARVSSILLNNKNIAVGIDGVHYLYLDNHIDKTVSGIAIKKMLKYENELLVSTNRNVLLIDAQKPLIKDTIWDRRATCAYKFEGTYMIGTLNGLFSVDTKKKITDIGKEQPLLSSRISTIEKQGNILWVATYGNGILAYSNGKILKHITEQDGLSSNMCRNLVLDKNYLWVGTDKGLNKISLNNTAEKIIKYSSNDGLNCDIVNNIFVENDSVYIATPYGLTIFTPNTVADTSIAKLNIEDVTSKNTRWGILDSNIHLQAGDNRLYIEYSCVSFKSQGTIAYYYQLLGADTAWHTTDENSVEFASLSPGDYELHLYAINAFGKKSNEIVLEFSVDKFFYQELWFQVLIILGVALLLWYFISRRIIKIRKDEERKLRTQKRLAELEQMAFRSQMNPHFIFNCLNSIQQYIFSKNVIDANRFITEFSSLIRQTLDISSKKTITLEEEKRYLSTYLKLEHTRFEGAFDYDISLSDKLQPDEIFLPPLLLQPFVENSIRHGIRNLSMIKGKVNIEFINKDDFLLCIIEDNGIGRKKSQKIKNSNAAEYQSKGMSLIQKRIEALNTESNRKINILLEDCFPGEENCGTKITIKIPI